MGCRSFVCYLVCPEWAAQGLPMVPGLGLFTEGFLLLPCPRSALVGLASPWRGRLWAVRPGCASPGVPGVPSVCFLLFFPLFFRFCFVFFLGQRWDSFRVLRLIVGNHFWLKNSIAVVSTSGLWNRLRWKTTRQVWHNHCCAVDHRTSISSNIISVVAERPLHPRADALYGCLNLRKQNYL